MANTYAKLLVFQSYTNQYGLKMIVDAISICVISYSETETEGRLQRTLKYSVSLQEEKKRGIQFALAT